MTPKSALPPSPTRARSGAASSSLSLPPVSAEGPVRRRMMRRLLMLGTAVMAGALIDDGVAWKRLVADYRTDVGKQQELALGSHASLRLNTRTALDVRETPEALHVRLIAGELLLDQRPGGRPVVIDTTQGSIDSRHGRIVVRRLAGETTVNVLNGSVTVQAAGITRRPDVVTAGHRLLIGRQGVGALAALREEEVAWVNGLIVARQMRLADFVDELQRYSTDLLRCDPGVADLMVSGQFPISNVKHVFDSLSHTLPLRVDVSGQTFGHQQLRLKALG